MHRRTFLKGTVLGAASVAVGIDCVGAAAPAPGLRVFSTEEATTLGAVAARILQPLDAEKLRTVVKLDRLFAAADPLSQHDFKQLLALLDNRFSGFILEGHFTPFRSLAPSAQDAVLTSWRDSSLSLRRSGFQALQRLCEAVTYADPTVYPDIGYPGPPLLVRPDGTTVGGMPRP